MFVPVRFTQKEYITLFPSTILSIPTVCHAGIVPYVIFVVPYRNRKLQLDAFLERMSVVMEDWEYGSYQIYIINQGEDGRSFNRGAMKNIGFLVAKQTYPQQYRQITFVFNDVDTIPSVNQRFAYQTVPGTIKHFYGFQHALGGIFSINGGDFEKINGFPNYWGWGYEDNEIMRRVVISKLHVDYSQFVVWKKSQFKSFSDGKEEMDVENLDDENYIRQVNIGEFKRYLSGSLEGITEIKGLKIQKDMCMVNVIDFKTHVSEDVSVRTEFDIRNGRRPFGTYGEPTMRPGRIQLQR